MKFFNTLTGRKEEFVPREPGRVTMYVCGPTTYNFIHLGNARPLVVFDTLRRYLEYRGWRVFYVQNFTDIDDKIIKRAKEEGLSPQEVAARYIKEFFTDADALNVRRADFYPRVTDHIPDIIRAVEALLRAGYAYEVDGNVYFAVDRFPEYGKLSRRRKEEMLQGARVEVDPRKKNPLDFALWKRGQPGEPAWDSPFGPGRPGWHIECSTMALKYLGPGFDIHGGGADLIFPHHENEIAQAEALTGKPLARFWLHNGYITVNQEKMSKSLGNFFLVREILQRFSPQAVRLYLLSTHYRSPLDFSDEHLEEAERSLERLLGARTALREALMELENRGETREASCAKAPEEGEAEAEEFLRRLAELQGRFQEALDDDFNTARSLAVIYELVREVNAYLHKGGLGPEKARPLREAYAVLEELAEGVLGLFGPDKYATDSKILEELIRLVLDIREEARQKRDWARADYLRERLHALGILVEDTPRGPRWRIKTKG